jgi:hypothetical protein
MKAETLVKKILKQAKEDREMLGLEKITVDLSFSINSEEGKILDALPRDIIKSLRDDFGIIINITE